MDKKDLACAILRAQEIYEASWNGSRYTLSKEDAAYKAMRGDDLDMCYIISTLITLDWNGVQNWAKTCSV